MALTARNLIDTSAAARMRDPDIAARLAPMIEAGLVATTASLHHLIVVHYDAAFDTAATVVEFEHAWVLPRESR